MILIAIMIIHLLHCRSEMLATGVERIIEQVVEPKIQHIFRPQIEKLVKETLNPDASTSDNNANGVDNVGVMPTGKFYSILNSNSSKQSYFFLLSSIVF